MDTLTKKLEELKKAAEQIIPSIKTPKPPSTPDLSNMEAPKAPKAAAPSASKDPLKSAQQLKDPTEKDQAVKQAKQLKEGLKFNSGGQWSMSKDEELDKVFPVPLSP